MKLYRVVLPYAVYAIYTDDSDCIIDAAPIGRWSIGKKIDVVSKWADRKGGSVTMLKEKASVNR